MSANIANGESFYEVINLLCNRFEAEWQANRQPQIDQYLTEAPEGARPELVTELLKLDIYYRRDRGDTILPADYLPWFADHASLIDTLLAERASAPQPTALTHAGRYRLEGLIGSGGMADVYRAHDPDFRCFLAVKVLKEEYKGRADLVARFLEEAQITGQLQHPGVPPVRELGRLPDGRPFLAMKLIQGNTLADLLSKRKDPADGLTRFLTIFEQVCQVVAYAHSRGIIHRDIKPLNIMVGAFGEVQVMDWGLAKTPKLAWEHRTIAVDSEARLLAHRRLRSFSNDQPPEQANDGEVSLFYTLRADTVIVSRTKQGAVLGTLAYMPPEQAKGEIDRLDERSDVFSLGATLCEGLTGAPPYRESSSEKRWQQAKNADLADAFRRLDACGADRELIGLAKQCLAADMDLRLREARAVANAAAAYQAAVQERLKKADLDRAAAEARAQAERRTAAAERQAQRRTVWLAAASMLLIVFGASGAWWYQRQQSLRKLELKARADETIRQVTSALTETKRLVTDGWQQADDPDRWRAIISLAHAAMDRGKSQLATGIPSLELTEELRRAEGLLDEADRLCKFRQELDRIYLAQAAFHEGDFEFKSAGPLYASAMTTFGLDLARPDKAAAKVRASPIRAALESALEDWARINTSDIERRRIECILGLLGTENDSFRARWRKAVASRDELALTWLAQGAEVEALPTMTIVNMGRDLRTLHLFVAAEHLLLARQQRTPTEFWLYHELGWVLQGQGLARSADAARFFTGAVALRKNNPGVYNNLAIALHDAGRLEEAVRNYNIALQIDPQYAQAYNNLAVTLFKKGELVSAERYFRKAITIKDGYAGAHYSLANCLVRQHRLKEAIEEFEIALAINPKFAQAHTNLGLAVYETGDLDGAMRRYRMALEINPKLVEAHVCLAAALVEKHELDQGILHYQTALDVKPESNDSEYEHIHYNLGSVLMRKGDLDNAIRHFLMAAKINPKLSHAYNSLGLALQAKRRSRRSD